MASAGARGGTGLEALTRTRTNYYYLGGQRVAMRQGVVGQGRDSVYYLHPDHLGSTSEVTTAAGELYARQRYAPYGQVRYSEGTPPTTYNYTGQRLDGTGLLYYGARYCDSLSGGIPLAKPQLDRHPSNSYNPPL